MFRCVLEYLCWPKNAAVVSRAEGVSMGSVSVRCGLCGGLWPQFTGGPSGWFSVAGHLRVPEEQLLPNALGLSIYWFKF